MHLGVVMTVIGITTIFQMEVLIQQMLLGLAVLDTGTPHLLQWRVGMNSSGITKLQLSKAEMER